jgi:hypothetical protein
MTAPSPFFAKPDSGFVQLRIQPRLASWMASGHPDQVRLEEFLAHSYDLLEPRLEKLADPLALFLDVGLRSTIPISKQHDLDNYVFPLASRITKRSGRHFVSVWCSKRHAETSQISITRAVPAVRPTTADCSFMVRTSASSESVAYKQQIQEQLADATELPDGPIALQLRFCVGPRRSWPNLWKPTIDALDRILGRTMPQRKWNPRDGRIVELGLHCRIDPMLGNDVTIAIEAAVIEGAPPTG